MPSANVYERPEGLVVHVELAGISADAIDVHVADQSLVISGQRDDPVCPTAGPDCRVRRMEIDYGPFERVIPLPCRVDGEHASARSRHGILEILLPRAAPIRAPRKQRSSSRSSS